MDFTGKTVIVTGSTQGIGRQVAVKFGSLGANVVINGIDTPEQRQLAEEAAAEVKAAGGDAVVSIADVSKQEETDALIACAAERFGAIDVIVNNAGITRDNLLIRMSESEWDSVLSVNLKGAFNVIHSAAKRLMKQRSGVIINMSSVSGVAGNAGQANYSASKAGLIGLTKSVARELASRGIRCNAVAPGFIKTAMTDKLSEEIKEAYMQSIPLKRFGEVEDIANAVAFLASDDAKYITGQVLNIDGGFIM